MATPVTDHYTCATGGTISAGRNAVPPNTAIIGDSISTESYGLSSAYWATALTGGRARIILQGGVGGASVDNWLTWIDNSWLDPVHPGLAGIPDLGRVFFRLGSNDCSESFTSKQARYQSMWTKLAGYCNDIYLLSVPPQGGAYAPWNGSTIVYNTAYAAYAAAHSDKFTFLDDTAVLRNGDGTQKTEYFSDGLHFNGAGMYYAGLELAAFLASRNVYSMPSPVERTVSDIYPAGSEWHSNPLNVGTGGTVSVGASGQVANGWSVFTDAGATAVVCSKVAADAGDPNTTPWQRFNFTSVHSGGYVQADSVPVGRDLTTADPLDLEGVVEFRLNNLDLSKLQYFEFSMIANNYDILMRRMRLNTGIATSVNHTGVLRHRVRRIGSGDPTSAKISFYALAAASGTNIGSIDFRNLTVRG